MNRRSFFKGLLAGAAAAVGASKLADVLTKPRLTVTSTPPNPASVCKLKLPDNPIPSIEFSKDPDSEAIVRISARGAPLDIEGLNRDEGGAYITFTPDDEGVEPEFASLPFVNDNGTAFIRPAPLGLKMGSGLNIDGSLTLRRRGGDKVG